MPFFQFASVTCHVIGGADLNPYLAFETIEQILADFCGRGIDPMKPWTIPNVLGIAGRQQLGKRMITRFARNLGTIIPFLVGAVIGARVNSVETTKLSAEMRLDLRRVAAEKRGNAPS